MMLFSKENITGTLINYYLTCKREAWLYSRAIHADQGDENIAMGKALAELKEEKKLHDFPFSNLHFDRIGKQRGHILVTEYKKSMKNPEAAKWQLLFYMEQLQTGLKLKVINGKVVSGKKSIFVEGSEDNFRELESLKEELLDLVNEEKAPLFTKNRFCKSCGYRDYCME